MKLKVNMCEQLFPLLASYDLLWSYPPFATGTTRAGAVVLFLPWEPHGNFLTKTTRLFAVISLVKEKNENKYVKMCS